MKLRRGILDKKYGHIRFMKKKMFDLNGLRTEIKTQIK